MTRENIKVVIDAGHGGVDPGAIGLHGIREADITIAATRMLFVALSKFHEVLLTRVGDEYVSLGTRVDRAVRFNADLFVSLHCNASEYKNASGIEVCVFSRQSKAARIGEHICELVSQTLAIKNRGIKERPDLFVLRKTPMPALLVEMAFITNPLDFEVLSSPKDLGTLVDCIFTSIEYAKFDLIRED